MDAIVALIGSLGAVLFFAGVLIELVGVPIFAWLIWRACRDLHQIAESLQWVCYYTRKDHESSSAPEPQPLSIFGR